MLWKIIGKYSKQTSGCEKRGTENRLAKEKYLNIISLYQDSLYEEFFSSSKTIALRSVQPA